MSTIHVRHDGQSRDFQFEDVLTSERLQGIGRDAEGAVNPNDLNPDEVKMAVAQHLDAALTDFDDYQVEYHKNGNITLRPDAVFGA